MTVSRPVVIATIALFIGAMLIWRQVATAIVDHYGIAGAVATVAVCYVIAVIIDRRERQSRQAD